MCVCVRACVCVHVCVCVCACVRVCVEKRNHTATVLCPPNAALAGLPGSTSSQESEDACYSPSTGSSSSTFLFSIWGGNLA